MADLEAKAAERVIEACVRTPSVRKCVFTSSLLACVWRQNYPHDRHLPTRLDENCWSDESLCRDKKVTKIHFSLITRKLNYNKLINFVQKVHFIFNDEICFRQTRHDHPVMFSFV